MIKENPMTDTKIYPFADDSIYEAYFAEYPDGDQPEAGAIVQRDTDDGATYANFVVLTNVRGVLAIAKYAEDGSGPIEWVQDTWFPVEILEGIVDEDAMIRATEGMFDQLDRDEAAEA